jgi:hypothetical protein
MTGSLRRSQVCCARTWFCCPDSALPGHGHSDSEHDAVRCRTTGVARSRSAGIQHALALTPVAVEVATAALASATGHLANWQRGVNFAKSSEGSGQSVEASGGGGDVPRRPGVPEHWVAKPSSTGGGTKFVDPQNPHNSVRVMPGDPKSPFPNSQQPYVRHVQNGQSLDVNGNIVPRNTPQAHIPLKDFKWPF